MQINSVLNSGKMPQKRMECFKTAFGPSYMKQASVCEWHKRFKEVRDDEMCGRRKEVRTPELIGHRVRVRVTMLRFLGSSGRGSFRRVEHSSNRVRGHFHQDNTPVHNSILVTDYSTKMGIKTVPQPPYSPYLAPCDFWLFPKLRGCRYETV